MKALIYTANGVEDSEFFYPYYRLKEEGIEADTAGPEKGKITGKHGYTFSATKTISECKAEDYDILILPGGKAPESVRLEPQAVETTKKMMAANKITASICHGAQTLISAGVLKNRKATCWAGIKDDLIAAGAEYQDSEVVVDGNLITSRCPDDLPAFCRELMKMIK